MASDGTGYWASKYYHANYWNTGYWAAASSSGESVVLHFIPTIPTMHTIPTMGNRLLFNFEEGLKC
jgi:hypothetical protein